MHLKPRLPLSAAARVRARTGSSMKSFSPTQAPEEGREGGEGARDSIPPSTAPDLTEIIRPRFNSRSRTSSVNFSDETGQNPDRPGSPFSGGMSPNSDGYVDLRCIGVEGG